MAIAEMSRRQFLEFVGVGPELARRAWQEMTQALEQDVQYQQMRRWVEALVAAGVVRKELPQTNLEEGEILPEDMILFGDKYDLLPVTTYDNVAFVLKGENSVWFPKKITTPREIVWHNDSVDHDFEKDPPEKQKLYPEETKGWLLARECSAHFIISPFETIQTLPMGRKKVTRAFHVYNGNTGTIGIETTGLHSRRFPPETLTARTVDLTLRLMKYYRIPFSQMHGHMEVANGDNQTDPGFSWLWHLRTKLYQAMLGDRVIRVNWDYYFPPNCQIKDDLGNCWDCQKEIERVLEEEKRNAVLERKMRRMGVDF